MNPKTIVHIIDSLAKGGAETLLVGTINSLPQYKHIIVTLTEANDFEEVNCEKIYNLKHTSNRLIFQSIKKFKQIFAIYNPSIIHTHLYWGTIIGRLSLPKNCKLITTYHSLLYDENNGSQFSKKMVLLDKLTYRKKYYTLYISQKVKECITNAIPIKQNHQVLHNYVEDVFFQYPKSDKISYNPLRVVSVGNLRKEKNYLFLLKCFLKLKDQPIQLDIYGDGKEKDTLTTFVRENQLTNVSLKGKTDDLVNILPKYDLFLMGSVFEGFGIALVEGMALGLPCLVSDIEAFREVTQGKGIFFNPTNEADFLNQIGDIIEKKIDLDAQGQEMKKIASHYTKSKYLRTLCDIYEK